MTQRLSPWAFVLAVRDLERSTAYYRDVLGFELKWPEGSDWRLAERDGVRMMLGHCPDETPASEIGAHSWYGYLEVDDVDALYAEIVARGAVSTAPKDAPYGMREILVTTVDGHRFMFAHEIGRPRA